jgi:RimJ/RimL family protein N-acetyltransferase
MPVPCCVVTSASPLPARRAPRRLAGVVRADGTSEPSVVRLEPWGTGDLPLLEQLNDPELTKHVGGPETREELADRQSSYEPPDSRQFRIVVDGEGVGWVGYWEFDWRDRQVWEIGWAVIPRFHGRGIASSATGLLLERAQAERGHRFVHAFPKVENAASNAICRKLGFELIGETDFDARRAGVVRCNDWAFDLFPEDP